MQAVEELDDLGGTGLDPAPIPEPPKSIALDRELRAAKTEILRERRGIEAENLAAFKKKLDEANKALKDFSHGNLIKQIEEQHKTLKADLIAAANMKATNDRERQDKAEFENAVQVYLNKRLELARVRLQEIAQEEKQTTDARNQVCSFFRTPSGETRTGEVIAKLGTDHSHIERTEGLIFKSSIQVKCVGGVMSSDSPPDLALAVKAKGWNSFKFTKAKASYKGVNNLIGSIEEMLKVGIKDISIDPKLMEKLLAKPQAHGHSSGDYAAQLAKFIRPSTRNVSDSQKSRLEQLQRICAASRSAYTEKNGNPVFDADGNMISGKNSIPKPIQHQVDTFMRLTSDADREEYLEILFPLDVGKHAADFVDELNKRGARIKGYTPEEYFKKVMLGPRIKTDFMARRSEFDEEHDRHTKLSKFNKDATTLPERTAMFLDSNDETLLRRYARSEKLNGPGDSNTTRANLVKAVFLDVQAPAAGAAAPNPHAISLHNPTLSSRYIVREDDKRAFLLKTLALFENIKVLNARGDATDFPRTAVTKAKIIEHLRTEAHQKFRDEKAANNPAAFDNFYKNKILIDELEERMLIKHFEQQKTEERIRPNEEPAKLNQLIDQHLSVFQRFSTENKALAFVTSLSPELQQRVWDSMDPDDPQTTKLRALILKKYIEIYEENPTPAALHFLDSAIGPLMKEMTRELSKQELIAKANELVRSGTIADKAGAQWTDAELSLVQQRRKDECRTALAAMNQRLHELCLQTNINGTKPAQNRALACIRENIAERGSMYQEAIAPLEPTQLFKDYFNSPPGPSVNKLLEVLKCYATVRGELLGPRKWLLDRRFKEDMRNLLYPGGLANSPSDNLIRDFNDRSMELCPAPEDKPIRDLIKILGDLPAQRTAPESSLRTNEEPTTPLVQDLDVGNGFSPFDEL